MLFLRIIAVILVATLCGCGIYDALTHVDNDVDESDAGVGDVGPDSDTNGNGPDPDGCDGCDAVCIDGECVEVVGLSAGGFHTCAVVDDGRLACWGSNQQKQLGRDEDSNQERPVFVDDLDFVEEVSAGWWQTCAIADGDQLRCWGYNSEGQLGIGSIGNSIAQPQDVTGINSAQLVAAGQSHGCAVHDGGAVSCWGAAFEGQLGHGHSSTDLGLPPQPVEGFDGSPAVTDLSAGWGVSAAIAGGELKTWGDNEDHQISQTDIGHEPTPVAVDVLDDSVSPTSVSAGWHHSCAVVDGDEVLCWGKNEIGQLGHDTSDSAAPVVDLPAHPSIEIDAGWGAHSCAQSNLGLHCWGNNDSGQLGAGEEAEEIAWQAIEIFDEPMADVAVGHSHTCALTESGEVYCWGSNSHGQLGVGEAISQSPDPLPVGAP